jgi:hypothetical protein
MRITLNSAAVCSGATCCATTWRDLSIVIPICGALAPMNPSTSHQSRVTSHVLFDFQLSTFNFLRPTP